MKPELQKKLFDKYPKIFREKDLSMQETCMCWGIDTGDGWFKLIDALCNCLQFDTDENNYPQVEAVQIKEKFGGLRYYIKPSETCYEPRRLNDVIAKYEEVAAKTCEATGKQGVLMKSIGGWYKTLNSEYAESTLHYAKYSEVSRQENL